MLDIQNVSASYGDHLALDKVSLAVEPGEIVGVVGPNGAGKTTLFKVLARIIEKYQGSIAFNALPLATVPQESIGYLAETPFLFEFFTPVEMLLFERSIRFPSLPEENVFNMLSTLGMDEHLHKPISTLSSGLKKRVAVAATFMGSPQLLILDEPLNSLDIQTVIVLKKLIREVLAREATVLVSSHVLDFFDGLIDRVVFLDRGAVHYTSSGDKRKAEELYTELFLPEESQQQA